MRRAFLVYIIFILEIFLLLLLTFSNSPLYENKNLLYNNPILKCGVITLGCLKCGRNTVSEQVFCPDCLAEMEKYPVRPGTVVQLPVRKAPSAAKKQPLKKRTVPLEEQLKVLKKRCRTLIFLLILVTAIAVALAIPAVEHFMETHHKIGQNYTTVTPTETN